MNPDSNLTVALVGYGKIGKAIHHRMAELGYPQPIIVDPLVQGKAVLLSAVKTADVCIEFTRPDAVVGNLLALSELGVPIVCGTTGWSQHTELVRERINQYGGSLIHASNFSIGVQILNRLTALASSMIASLDQYDVAIHEVHHRMKVDAPSGTALMLAETIMRHCPRKSESVVSTPQRSMLSSELCITSTRVGQVVGKHEITLDSEADTVRIAHEAKSRAGFVEGALLAAKWIQGKRGFFSFEEVFDDITAS